VFGRAVLYEYEMDAMRISRYINEAYTARGRSESWAAWEKSNPSASKTLAWAAVEYEKAR
jgi:hypothetical protein